MDDPQVVDAPDDARTDGLEDPELWVLLPDPRRPAGHEGDDLPSELIAGGWPVFEDGDVGPFHANELHRSAGEDAPGDPDPVGAALQLVLEGRAEIELLQLVLQDAPVHAAINADGRPLVVRSDDGRLCLLVATCEERRRESAPPEWERAGADRLIALIGDDLDLLVNPAGPMPIRLDGDLVRGLPDVAPERAAAALERLLAEQAGASADPDEGGSPV